MITSFIQSIFFHIEKLFTSTYGFLLLILCYFGNFLLPEWYCFAVVGGGIVADLICGIIAAVKLKKFILSKAIRDTCFKVGCYSFMLIGVFVIEKIAHDTGFIGIKVAAAIAAGCELWSISASLLIIYPDFPFLKIFRLQLKGEMESKTGKNLDNILND
ncbi:hypothetical protein CLV62_12585 [Dysgonomonas alginatilytica]|uniref:Uncharacterized protein n=1 Tax=Dysgonomonas alginatilytica TaxID=1605892 RepID=A0A2V3PK55_9BACT|nr:hypothetical protein [Dysgonomonas alginatilytica]PXV61252.1 hypothetical protein CLV62_12585 [Dysgonomonas alginatilytica]